MIFLSPDRKNGNGIPAIIDSLIPTSAFLEEPRAAGLAIKRAEDIGHAELLSLATFLASNNFPGDTNAEKLREWLKTHSTMSVLEALSSMKGPTADSLLENLFQFAIEDEDILTVKYLLQAGVNPNGHKCRLLQVYNMNGDDLTPLQFALIRGNTELALELIKAGSTTDQVNTGWKSSALVLAIIGDNVRGNKQFWGNDYFGIEECEDNDIEGYKGKDTRHGTDYHLATHGATDHLFNLIMFLINAGAAVNLGDIGQHRLVHSKILGLSDRRGQTLKITLNEVHTPLSAASKYQKKEIVDLRIRNGADVRLLTDQGTSALHECLYSPNQLACDISFNSLRPLQDRTIVSGGRTSLDTVMGVVRSLIDAGANVNEEFNCRTIYSLFDHYSGPESYTIFDLGVLTGSIDTVNMLISAGSHMTELSVEYAIQVESLDVLNYLLDAGALVSTDAISIATGRQDWYLRALLTKSKDIWMKEAALLEAIRSGNFSVIEYLFNDGTFTCRNVLSESTKLTRAIESCCCGGHIEALRLILHNSFNCQLPLYQWFGYSLCLAIVNGPGEVIDALLSAGADVNWMPPNGQTPLVAAIATKNKKVFDRLMDMGAILNPKTPYSTDCSRVHGVSGDALIAAIQWGDSAVVNHLLERGADIEAFGMNYRNERRSIIGTVGAIDYGPRGYCYCSRPITAALMAKNLNLVYYLIRRGVKINNPLDGESTIRGPLMTPLAAAIQIRDYEMVDFIIREGANPYDCHAIMGTLYEHELRGVLRRAMHNSHQPSNIKCIDRALTEAIKIDDAEMVKAIICSPLWGLSGLSITFAMGSALECALSYLSDSTIHMLLSFGADPNTIFSSGFMAGSSALNMVIMKFNSLKLVKFLLEAGAEADTSILFGRRYSPVQFAVKKRNLEIAQILLGYGSNPNSVSVPSSASIDENQEDDYRTPLQIAVQNQDVKMMRILFLYKVDANSIFINEDKMNSDKYVKWSMPRTPLQEASLQGIKEIVELLLEHGADVNSPPVTGDGATALQYAAMQGFLGIAHLLLEHDAEVNAAPAKTDGRTALEGAAEHGRVDMVQLLLNAGANIFGDRQAQYENAITRASGNGHHAIRRMLEKHHADRE